MKPVKQIDYNKWPRYKPRPRKHYDLIDLDFDRSKTLQELDGQDWGETDSQYDLVQTCYALRHKPLAQFTDGNLRIMIGQGLSLPYLVPTAIERLATNITAGGDMFPGALAHDVATLSPDFWQVYPELRSRFDSILKHSLTLPAHFEQAGSEEQYHILRSLNVATDVYKAWQQMPRYKPRPEGTTI